MISSNSILQTNVREGYRITTLEVIKLIEDLISYYGAKVKIEDLSNTLTLTLSKTAQRRSLSVVSNRSTALITDKFSIALLTEPAILNNANVALVDAVHYSVIIDALTMTLIKDDNDLLGTVNSYIKLRRLRARRKTEAADSRYAKASRGRTKKDKDLEDSDTSSDQLGKEAQLKKTRDEEELAKLDSLLDSDDYRLDSSSDINPENNLEDKEATTAKDLAREQKERLKALLNAKTRDGLSLIDAYILYFKELLSNNSRIFANAIGIGKTRAIVLAVLIRHCNSSDPLALRFCFFSNSPLENISRLTKKEAMKMQIDTTNAISKALAAANKLVALQSYTILEANTPAVHSKATKHCLALSAAQFIIVCGFRKVDKHIFRAYNTISVTAQRTIIRKSSSYIKKRAILLPSHVTRNIIANVKYDASEHESSYKYKELISQGAAVAQRFMLKRILKTRDPSCKVKRFTLNSVKDLFTNLSKDYFLVREARAITKSSLKF
ncbi:hypothetical protein HBH48_075220 [Parastagonospora nodorum]|nr:hypothetical protein HBH48_075220 [Parastagonospora nodorum]